MTQALCRLSALAVAKAKKPGLYNDGGGLCLQITATGGRSWVFRFMLRGRPRMMGLGPLHTVSLAEAREQAARCRKLCLAGIDPIDARRGESGGGSPTFAKSADAYIQAHQAGWRNAKHAEQWRVTLDTYAGPVIGHLPVQAVDLSSIMKILDPIWTTKTETASRLRGRIEAILDWATVRGYRHGENPARWRGHLAKLLPAPSKIAKVVHHPALPYADAAAFVAELRQRTGTSARALEFLILTAARTGEVLGARWEEIDLQQALWTVPAERIKTRKQHRVPLSAPALAILDGLLPLRREGGFVFPGRGDKPFSNMVMLVLLRRMGRGDLTAHGFRSTFRDWAAECTDHPREVVEMALAHGIEDKVEAAYRRGDLFERRRRLMQEWGRFATCASQMGRPAASIGAVGSP